MYAYRYRHLKKKKINGAVWLGGLLLAVIGILLQTNRSFFAKLGEEGAKSCCEKVLDFYLPGLSYSVKDETEWSFVEKVIDVLFYGENYEPESGSYQTQIESDLSYEAILAREAADENYVDEKTGEVIPSVGSADGTSLSDEKDAGGQTGRARCGGEHRRAAGRGRCSRKSAGTDCRGRCSRKSGSFRCGRHQSSDICKGKAE